VIEIWNVIVSVSSPFKKKIIWSFKEKKRKKTCENNDHQQEKKHRLKKIMAQKMQYFLCAIFSSIVQRQWQK